MHLTFQEAAKILDISVTPDNNPLLTHCAFDSREVQQGSLFVCLPGQKRDGHDFIGAAIKNGAAAILAQKPVGECAVPIMLVPDTVKAMGKLAAYWRSVANAKVIAVTGTAGKTTLKESLVSILQESGETAATQKNHNNQIGLPAAILNMSGNEKFWVLEAGISHAGDMDELGAIIHPDIALILNVGPGHNEGLGAKGTAWHKARLLEYVRPNGLAIISSDYPELKNESEKYPVKKIYFGLKQPGRFVISEKAETPGMYKIFQDNQLYEVQTSFQGDYGAENALAAWTCARMLGVESEKIKSGFRKLSLPEHRFNILKGPDWQIIDDTYNANPLSMEKMLMAAANMARKEGGLFIAVLGEMLELGEKAREEHFHLGELLARLAPNSIFWKGDFLEEVTKGYKSMGGTATVNRFYEERDFLQSYSSSRPEKPVTVFFKGSRSNHLEKCAEALKVRFQQGSENVL